jgi:soluble lytic murein transglycosylase-like protein
MKVVLALLAVFPALAGEYAVLQNGFRIPTERHEVIGDVVRLHTNTGDINVPAREIARFEVEEYVKPAEPPKTIVQETTAVPLIDPRLLIDDAAARHGLLPEFVHSVAAAESAYRLDAVSPKGALGLMQLMPGTARELGVDPLDPVQNAEAGARYLKQLLIKYKDSKDPVRLALAAYNAGPGAVDRYAGIPPYRETQQYIERVLRKYLAQIKSKKS